MPNSVIRIVPLHSETSEKEREGTGQVHTQNPERENYMYHVLPSNHVVLIIFIIYSNYKVIILLYNIMRYNCIQMQPLI